MGIQVLGPVHVDGGEALGPRERQVLAALVVRRPGAIAPDELVEAVWHGAPPHSWSKQVQICVGRLRKVLGAAAILTVPDGYLLNPAMTVIDLDQFEQLIERGRERARTGEPDRATTTLSRALALWRGHPFGGLDAWDPARIEAARLEEMRRVAEEELLEVRLAIGEHRAVVAEAEASVAREPLREHRWATLALAQYRCGRQADALSTLRRARAQLREQLGIDPSAELTALEQRILQQDPSLRAVPEPRSVSTDCPYKGMSPHEPGDMLFGREAEIERCLERLRTAPLLVVTGPSGCGKSSLIRAGIVPALRRLGQRVVITTPDPQASLPQTDPDGSSPVLVLDHVEELFASDHADDVVRGYCAALTDYAVGRAPVVIAVRADHLAGLMAEPRLGRLAERGLHLLGALTGEALREAIERPAEESGLRLEPGLVDLVVRDAEGEPGAMPLMSHALAETWKRRDGPVLTAAGYRATGGIRGAVARSADLLYESLPEEERALLRGVLLRLVAPSVDGDPVRCRVQSKTLRGDADRERVVALLIGARLITAEDEVVELSHEALARAWPRLQAWLDDDTAGQRILRHLTATASGWEGLGRPDSELYRGGRLESALEYRASAGPDLTPLEHAFLDASAERAESERAELRRRADLDRRRNRRLQMLLAATGALLLVAVAAGLTAMDNSRQAIAARDDSRLAALVSTSLALRSTDRDTAALLAVEAVRRRPADARARSALLGTFTAAGGFLGHRYIEGSSSLSGAVVKGTDHALVSVSSTELAVMDLRDGSTIARLGAPGDIDVGVNPMVRVSDNGRSALHVRAVGGPECLASTGSETRDCTVLTVLDVRAGELVLGPLTMQGRPGDAAISRDGALVAVADEQDGSVRVIGTSDGGVLARVPGRGASEDPFWSVRAAALDFGPDDLLYVGSLARSLRVIDPRTGVERQSFAVPPNSSNQHVQVGRDGTLVAGGSRALIAVDIRDGRRLWTADIGGDHPDPCPWFTASERTNSVYCGNHYGEIFERDRSTGQRTATDYAPQLGSVGDLAVTSDGGRLVAFGAQTPAISQWALDGSGPISRLVARGHVLADGYDFNDATTVVVARRGSSGGAMSDYALWDVVRDLELDPLRVDMEGVGWLGPDVLAGMQVPQLKFGWYDVASRVLVGGDRIGPECDHLWPSRSGMAWCGHSGGAWTIDPTTRQRTEPTLETDGVPWYVSATRDRERVVVTVRGPENVTTVYDGRTGEQLEGRLVGPETTAVSLDGTLVGSERGAITRYDLASLAPIADLPGAGGEVNTLQFSDDGMVLLATSNDQTASLYDVDEGIRLGDPITTDAPLSYPAYLRPDGRELAVTSSQGVEIWDLDPDAMQRAACRLAGRNLKVAEWSAYLGDFGEHRETCPDL